MVVRVPLALTEMMVMKGSVAVDGVSLTVAGLRKGEFEVSLIPHTLAATTLGGKGPGARVNIECDVLGKWVRRVLGRPAGEARAGGTLSLEALEEQGP